MLWLPGPSGVEFSEDVDSWRVRGLWRDECMVASVGQGLPESRKSFGVAGGQETDLDDRSGSFKPGKTHLLGVHFSTAGTRHLTGELAKP